MKQLATGHGSVSMSKRYNFLRIRRPKKFPCSRFMFCEMRSKETILCAGSAAVRFSGEFRDLCFNFLGKIQRSREKSGIESKWDLFVFDSKHNFDFCSLFARLPLTRRASSCCDFPSRPSNERKSGFGDDRKKSLLCAHMIVSTMSMGYAHCYLRVRFMRCCPKCRRCLKAF